MKIRTQFMISMVVLGLILLVVSAAVIITNQRVEHTHQQEILATQIERQAYELGYLANDYLLYRESQQASRWEAKFASFSNDIANLEVNTPEQQALLANIKINQQRLKAVFAEIKASIESAPQTPEAGFDANFMQISWSRLEVQNQGMIFDASRLEEMLREQEDQLRRMTGLLSLVLVGVLGAFLLGNYALIFRRTLQAIAELQAGTKVIGSGDLDFAIAVKNEDEIGELSHAFNQMTASLKQVTASKADLEKEISERKRVEEQLESERGNLQMMFNAVNVGMLLMGEDGSARKVNNVVTQWTGKKPSEMHGFQPGDVLGCIHVADDPGNCGHTPYCSNCSIRNTFETVMRSGQPVHNVEAEATLLLKGKQTQFWLELSADPLVIDGKQHAILALNDITARKQAEDGLRQKEAELREAQRIAHIGSWYWDAKTDVTTGSEELLRIYGFDPATQAMPDFTEQRGLCYPVEDWERVNAAVQRTLETGVGYELDVRAIHDGTTIWITTRSEVVRDAVGQIVGLRGTVQDITWRKQAEKALLEASLQKQASQYARTLIEVSIDPLVTISPEGKITDVNEATIKATGMPREELVGTNFSGYFTEPEKAEQAYRHVFAWGFVTDYPLTIRHRDGHLMDVFYNASLYKDAYGSVLGAFAAARDVTALKRAESELRRHKENLEALVKERTSDLEESNQELARSNENLEQFAYVASHDLQEPLRIMSSYSQLLERRYKGRLDQDADEFIAFIVDAAARMQKLITDLLAYSRAGRGTTDMVEVNCDQLVRRLVAGMAPTIESADGHVTFDGLPSIMAHESSLVQLFQNLIGNALKFRGEQPPRIHLSASQAGGEWVFSVSDNGIGIEPQYNQRIFMIFQRLHARDKYPGTGIGLSICKKIVENLGGRIWVESEPGQGSTFYFTVPIRKE